MGAIKPEVGQLWKCRDGCERALLETFTQAAAHPQVDWIHAGNILPSGMFDSESSVWRTHDLVEFVRYLPGYGPSAIEHKAVSVEEFKVGDLVEILHDEDFLASISCLPDRARAMVGMELRIKELLPYYSKALGAVVSFGMTHIWPVRSLKLKTKASSPTPAQVATSDEALHIRNVVKTGETVTALGKEETFAQPNPERHIVCVSCTIAPSSAERVKIDGKLYCPVCAHARDGLTATDRRLLNERMERQRLECDAAHKKFDDLGMLVLIEQSANKDQFLDHEDHGNYIRLTGCTK